MHLIKERLFPCSAKPDITATLPPPNATRMAPSVPRNG